MTDDKRLDADLENAPFPEPDRTELKSMLLGDLRATYARSLHATELVFDNIETVSFTIDQRADLRLLFRAMMESVKVDIMISDALTSLAGEPGLTKDLLLMIREAALEISGTS